MQIVQIKQDENNGFVCVVPAEVHVVPVDDIDEANKALKKLVKGQLEKLDINFDPIADGEHRSTDFNAVIDEEDANGDFYYLKTVKEASNTEPVAEIAIEETPIQMTWFLVG